MEGTTIYDLHGRLIRDTFGSRLTDADAFLVFVLFHLYRVELSGTLLTDRPGVLGVAALTQRGVSESLASIWTDKADPRARYLHWYYRWNGDWGSYGHAEQLTPAEAARLEEIRTLFEQHPFVRRIEFED